MDGIAAGLGLETNADADIDPDARSGTRSGTISGTCGDSGTSGTDDIYDIEKVAELGVEIGVLIL